MEHKTQIGREFPINKFIDARTRYLREVTRTKIALTLMVTFVGLLVCASILSLATWDFTILRSFWIVVAAPFGAVTAYYFGETSANDKINDEGST